MKAIQIQRTGGPEVLEPVDLVVPSAGAGEVLVRVEACGVNFIDTYYREGRYAAALPYTLGQEAAGTVVAVGAGVAVVRVGDRVAPAVRVIVLPEEVSSEMGAAAMLQGMTAHYLSHTCYAIRPGDPVLIHAGAGGTGLLLTQMAKMLGARVFTTVSTEAKEALSREAGADEVIRYDLEPFEEAVRRLTDGAGLPVVYDSVGKTTFQQSLKCLRPRGLMVLFGGASGAVPPFDLIQLSAMGSLFVTRPTLKDYVASREELEMRASDVFGWMAEGKLTVRVGHRYALAEAAEAHRDLEGRKTTGKVLLIP